MLNYYLFLCKQYFRQTKNHLGHFVVPCLPFSWLSFSYPFSSFAAWAFDFSSDLSLPWIMYSRILIITVTFCRPFRGYLTLNFQIVPFKETSPSYQTHMSHSLLVHISPRHVSHDISNWTGPSVWQWQIHVISSCIYSVVCAVSRNRWANRVFPFSVETNT
jgi:hypothetical protein